MRTHNNFLSALSKVMTTKTYKPQNIAALQASLERGKTLQKGDTMKMK